MLEDSRLIIGLLLAYHYGWNSPYFSKKHNRLTDLAIRHGLLRPEAPHITEDKRYDGFDSALLTTTGQHCVAAHKKGRWNKLLDELSARGGSVTLESMIEAVNAEDLDRKAAV